MKYEKEIESLRREMSMDIRFTEYGYKEVQGIKCPNPNNKDWLNTRYDSLMNELFNFLSSEPPKELIEEFVIKQIDSFDRKGFLESEYNQLMICYTGILYFALGLRHSRKHYDAIRKP